MRQRSLVSLLAAFAILAASLVFPAAATARGPFVKGSDVRSLVREYAPLVVFHPDEQYFLDAPDDVLRGPALLSWGLVYNENNPATFHQTVLGSMKARPQQIDEAVAWLMQLPEASDPAFRYWFDLDPRLYPGNLNRAQTYVHVVDKGPGVMHLQFWFYSPYNGSLEKAHATIPGVLDQDFSLTINNQHIGQHTGDWEHVTLRLEQDAESGDWVLTAVFLSQHSGGQWVSADDLTYTDDGHPVVYAAKNSHAFYAATGEHRQTFLQTLYPVPGVGPLPLTVELIDETDSGATFEAYHPDNFRLIASDLATVHVPTPPEWLDFEGRWGPYEVQTFTGSFGQLVFPYAQVAEGPTGPMQHTTAWQTGDGEP